MPYLLAGTEELLPTYRTLEFLAPVVAEPSAQSAWLRLGRGVRPLPGAFPLQGVYTLPHKEVIRGVPKPPDEQG